MILKFSLAVVLFLGPAVAETPFYIGTWKIDSAKVAPWANPKERQPDPTEMKSLVGKTVTITPTGTRGPRQFSCGGAKYVVKDYPADMLFQGAFGEMHGRDKSLDPAKVAAGVGFRGTSWKTLETGCGNEIDYHFIDPSTAAIGLNDYVYILKKQP